MELKFSDRVSLTAMAEYDTAILENLKVGFVAVNSTDSNSTSNNITLLTVVSKDSTILSFAYLHNFSPAEGWSTKFVSDFKIPKTGSRYTLGKGWINNGDTLDPTDRNKVFIEETGIYSLIMEINVKNFTKPINISFIEREKTICSSRYSCINYCNTVFVAVCHANLTENDNIEISVLVYDTDVFIGQGSSRMVYILKSKTQGFAVKLKNDTHYLNLPHQWLKVGPWSWDFYGLFVEDTIVYRNQILLKKSGTYEIAANLQISFESNGDKTCIINW